jgi:hypothetical protein
MGIPQILSPEDMINPAIDELSVMTYISYFRDWVKFSTLNNLLIFNTGSQRKQKEIS